MSDVCWFCLRDLETNDGVPLCHACYNILGDWRCPFYSPTLIMQDTWREIMSDPDAKMWLHKRLENR